MVSEVNLKDEETWYDEAHGSCCEQDCRCITKDNSTTVTLIVESVGANEKSDRSKGEESTH